MKSSKFPHLAIALLSLSFPFVLSAVPTAVDDAFSVNEDAVLSIALEALINTDFDTATGGGGEIALSGVWSYLDQIENENGSSDPYPTDGAGRAWTAVNYDVATSTVGVWETGSLPLQAGGVDGFAGAPDVLDGIAAAGNGGNLVTTYLFRKSFTLTASEAAETVWSANVLADDGYAVYLNGTEVLRNRLPSGALTTTTFGNNLGDENVYDSLPLTIPPGLLVAGVNVIAVEVHQSTLNSSDVGLDLELIAGGAGTGLEGGFTYLDDLFGTSNAGLADGSHLATGGFNGTGGLQVRAGGFTFPGNRPTSGGWRQAFTLSTAATVEVSLRYRLLVNNGFENDEFAVALAAVDGVRLGTAQESSLAYFLGDGNNGPDEDTGWQTFSVMLPLAAGSHNLDLGVYVNKSTANTEVADAFFDDVVVSVVGGGSGTGGVLANDTGNAASLVATLLTQPANGVVVMETDGTFTYTPEANFFGINTFSYRATDNTGNSTPATVTVTVNPVNDAPVAVGGSFSTAEDQVLTVSSVGGVLIGATDIDNAVGELTASVASDVSNGTLVLSPNGGFTYSPTSNFNGTDSFTFRVSDGGAQSDPATVTITVTPVDDPPVVVADSYTVDENGSLVVSIAGGTGGGGTADLILAGAEWSYLDNGSDQGVGWIAANFDDSAWATGAAQLGYGDGDEVTEVGFGPDPNDKYATTYFRKSFEVLDAEIYESVAVRLIRDDGAAAYVNGVEILRSNLVAEAAYDGFAPTSTGDENGWRDFVVDPSLLHDGTNWLAVEVHQAAPDSSDLSFDFSMSATEKVIRGVLANDTELEGAPLTAVIQTLPSHGTLSFNSDGTFTYTPAANYFGVDTFQYRASDGGLSSVGTATITVYPGPNDVPVAVADSYTVTEDQVLTVGSALGVLVNDMDADGDPMTAVLASNAGNGSVVLNANGSFVYTPAANFFGTDTFTYRAADAQGSSAATLVSITVTGVNDAPVAVADSFVVQPGQIFSGNVQSNDADADGNLMTATLVSGVGGGQLTLNGNGTFSYNPGAFTGTTSFVYRLSDGQVFSGNAQVTLVVNGRPTAVANGYSVVEDGALVVNATLGVLNNDSDPEGATITAILSGDVTNGVLSLAANGSFTYTPAADFSGTDSFTYYVTDGLQSSATVVVAISVTPVNDAPVAVADDYGVITNQTIVVDAADGVIGNDSDVDGNSLSVVLLSNVTNGVLALSSNGAFTYTPGLDFEGDDTFAYRLSDGLLESTALVTLHVGPDLNSIVINEIMYHPASENDAEEFIELTNIGSNPVNLTGWTFGSGVSFTFPTVTIPVGGFLVVAADVATFESVYGAIPNLVGGWVGQLSNSGERVRLYNADGVEVDDLTYADEGDWSVRQRLTTAVGWDWNSDHDGGGQSLELIFPGLSNKHGQNWSASQGGPTPGAANSVAAVSIPPMVLDVKHAPAVPKSTDPVRITARLLAEDGVSVAASVFWRRAPLNPGAFVEVTMSDDGSNGDGELGDGVFGATLPPMADETVVEFYIAVTDGVGLRTWPVETNLGQVANAHYQVDDEVVDGNWPIYRIVMTEQEDSNFVAVNRSSNERFHATLILDDCSGPVIRYNSSIRVRGAGSRSHTPPPMRVSVPHDNPWNQRTAMNWNTKYTYSQYIGMRLFQGAGIAAPDGKPMRVRWNGENRMRNDDFDYGLAVHMEVLDGDFVDDKFSNDKDGNLYKKVRPDNDWAFRNGNVESYVSDGWSKETNADENEWGDLDTFLGVMNNSPGAPDYVAQVEAVVDLDQWMKWFGAMAVVANGETNAANGADDDYSMYRGIVDPRFKFIPHDLDTILGDGDGSRITDPEHTIFDMIGRGDVLDPLVPLFSNPGVQVRYYQALRELLQGRFSKPEFDELVDNSLGGWVPTGQINNIKTFMDARRIYINGLVDAELGAAPPAPVGTTSSTLVSAHGALMISEVLASNTLLDYFGTYPDFVEVYNSGATAVDLGGMTMTDNLGEPAKFTFPAATMLNAGQRVFILGASDPLTPGLHLGFGLGSNGDSIYLMNGAAVVDGVTFGLQIPDYSIGRTGADLNTWALTAPTPGSANGIEAVGDPNGLRINEWLTQPETVFERDFIELYNPSTLPVGLGGLAITDEPISEPTRVQLPALSFIAPGGFALFEAVGSSASPGNANELPFKLGSDQGWLAISGVNGVEIDEVHYLCHRLDVSQGRAPDGSATYLDYVLPTPGFSNSTDLSNEAAIISGLRITEMMYHPLGGSLEYVELRNTGTVAFDLSGVVFTEGIQFEFPSMVLEPGEYVLVVENVAAFEAEYGVGLNVAGAYSGKLSNGGERVRLEIEALGAGILDFDYFDSWYPSTDGSGFALEIVDQGGVPSSWSERESWRAGSVVGGTPGSGGGDPAAYDNWVVAEFVTPSAGVTGKLDDPDQDGIANVLEFVLGGDPQVGNRGEMLEFSNEGGFLTLTYRRAVASIGLVELLPQVSGDDANWNAGAGLTVSELMGSDGVFETWKVRDATPIGVGRRRFLRILATCTDG